MMDELDKSLLAALAANSAIATSALARQLGVARSTVQARIERLERLGIIAGYTIRLGSEVSERRIRATVLVEVEPRRTPEVLARLKPMPEIEACHSTTGRIDLILQLAAETPRALDETLDRIGAIPGVRRSESLIQLATKFDRRM